MSSFISKTLAASLLCAAAASSHAAIQWYGGLGTSWTPEVDLVNTLTNGVDGLNVVPGSGTFIGGVNPNDPSQNSGNLYQSASMANGQIILTTGAVRAHYPGLYTGPTMSGPGGNDLKSGSNADIAALLGMRTNQTTDQNVLSFQFTVSDPSLDELVMSVIFASDEWDPSSGNWSMYWGNDTIAVIVDGVNYAYYPADHSLINVVNSASTYTSGKSVGYYGQTAPIELVAKLDPTIAVHTIIFAIADVESSQGMNTYGGFDSAMIVGGLALRTSCDPNDPNGSCYKCDPTDPKSSCYCDPTDPKCNPPCTDPNDPQCNPPNNVPEPAPLALLLSGLGLMGVTTAHRRRGQK